MSWICCGLQGADCVMLRCGNRTKQIIKHGKRKECSLICTVLWRFRPSRVMQLSGRQHAWQGIFFPSVFMLSMVVSFQMVCIHSISFNELFLAISWFIQLNAMDMWTFGQSVWWLEENQVNWSHRRKKQLNWSYAGMVEVLYVKSWEAHRSEKGRQRDIHHFTWGYVRILVWIRSPWPRYL